MRNKFFQHLESGDHYITDKPTISDWEESIEITLIEYCKVMHPHDLVYDIEAFPNAFTVTFYSIARQLVWRYEISHRMNNGVELFEFIIELSRHPVRLVGFNNEQFDYPAIHHTIITKGGHVTAREIYEIAQILIKGTDQEKFNLRVWDDQVLIPQVDLFKIHHFDNKSKMTSLKILEFNMRSDTIEDLPFPVGKTLSATEINILIQYNDHDVYRTADFYGESLLMIEFREKLNEKYDRNFTNFNDTKIGEQFFIMALEEKGVEVYRNGRKSDPIQTLHDSVDLSTIILPSITFQNPEFQRIKEFFQSKTITETKGVFKNLTCDVNGMKYVFGTGGLHGSIESTTVHTTETHQIIDVDVKGYYPNLSIANRFYPMHLGEVFCDVNEDIIKQRDEYKKGSPENKGLKLAANGSYGKSNSHYSPLFDWSYTMKITINGQLLLCMLAEWLTAIPGLKPIQANTDGLTILCPREHISTLKNICGNWEKHTGLELEYNNYKRMFIANVNSYIAEFEDGKLKRKKDYCYGDDLEWHKNHSAQVVAMAAEAALVRGEDIEQFIYNHPDKMDFMLRTKVPRSSKLMIEFADGTSEQLQNITRYYVSHFGGQLMKLMPALAKNKPKFEMFDTATGECFILRSIAEVQHALSIGLSMVDDSIVLYDAPWRRISVNAGWNVEPCNNMALPGSQAINYAFYIEEARKLVNPLIR